MHQHCIVHCTCFWCCFWTNKMIIIIIIFLYLESTFRFTCQPCTNQCLWLSSHFRCAVHLHHHHFHQPSFVFLLLLETYLFYKSNTDYSHPINWIDFTDSMMVFQISYQLSAMQIILWTKCKYKKPMRRKIWEL